MSETTHHKSDKSAFLTIKYEGDSIHLVMLAHDKVLQQNESQLFVVGFHDNVLSIGVDSDSN